VEKVKQYIKEAEAGLLGAWLTLQTVSLIGTSGATVWVILTQDLRNEYRFGLTVFAVTIILTGGFMAARLFHRLGRKS
jgi:hypothetical protein